MKRGKKFTGYTDPNGQRRANCPPHWPFGELTPAQMIEREKQECKLRDDDRRAKAKMSKH